MSYASLNLHISILAPLSWLALAAQEAKSALPLKIINFPNSKVVLLGNGPLRPYEGLMRYFTKINKSFREFWEIPRNFGAQSKEYQNLVVRALFRNWWRTQWETFAIKFGKLEEWYIGKYKEHYSK